MLLLLLFCFSGKLGNLCVGEKRREGENRIGWQVVSGDGDDDDDDAIRPQLQRQNSFGLGLTHTNFHTLPMLPFFFSVFFVDKYMVWCLFFDFEV